MDIRHIFDFAKQGCPGQVKMIQEAAKRYEEFLADVRRLSAACRKPKTDEVGSVALIEVALKANSMAQEILDKYYQ